MSPGGPALLPKSSLSLRVPNFTTIVHCACTAPPLPNLFRIQHRRHTAHCGFLSIQNPIYQAAAFTFLEITYSVTLGFVPYFLLALLRYISLVPTGASALCSGSRRVPAAPTAPGDRPGGAGTCRQPGHHGGTQPYFSIQMQI
jgi:hypothetical protein